MATAALRTSRTGDATVAVQSPRRRFNYSSLGLWIALVVSCIIWILPLVFLPLASLKSQADISSSSVWSLPQEWKWSNYPDAADKGNLRTVTENSFYIAIIKVPVGLFVSALAAFAIARLRFRGHRLILLLIALGAMVPIQIALAPMFTTMDSLGLLNS